MHAFYAEHHRWLQAWLRRQIGCPHQAQDLSHDTFEQMLRAPEAVALREPRAYLAVIAKRVLLNHWRRRDLERAYLEALAVCVDGLTPSAEDIAAALEALVRIDTLLGDLGARVRQVFLMNQLEDKTYREISQELGMPVISVRRAMAKAIAACCTLEP